MIRLSFLASQRKIVSIEIDGRVVRYFDEVWKNGLKIYPRSEVLLKQLLDSRSERMKAYGLNILEANKGKNLEEYESCKTEEEIAEYVIKDCKSKGLKQID